MAAGTAHPCHLPRVQGRHPATLRRAPVRLAPNWAGGEDSELFSSIYNTS